MTLPLSEQATMTAPSLSRTDTVWGAGHCALVASDVTVELST
jgi:hypothetical protein